MFRDWKFSTREGSKKLRFSLFFKSEYSPVRRLSFLRSSTFTSFTTIFSIYKFHRDDTHTYALQKYEYRENTRDPKGKHTVFDEKFDNMTRVDIKRLKRPAFLNCVCNRYLINRLPNAVQGRFIPLVRDNKTRDNTTATDSQRLTIPYCARIKLSTNHQFQYWINY